MFSRRGNGGPSSAELVSQENAGKACAQAEAPKIMTQKDLDKQTKNIKVVGDQAQLANDDAARRIRNRTLLAGIQNEEGLNLGDDVEAPTKKSAKKAKRATLIEVI